MPKVAISIGELSGDVLAAEVLSHLRTLCPDLECRGVTGPALREAGCESILSVEALSVAGVTEVVAHLPRLWRLRRHLARTFLDWKPDLFLGVDAPDFNLGLEVYLRQQGLRVAHLVSPTVWAWRPGRVKKVARAAETLFCLFPFEPGCYEGTGIQACFVGHPLADRLKPLDDVPAARRNLDLDPDRPTVALLPGSRPHEIEQLGGVMIEAARRVSQSLPSVQFVLPVAQEGFRPILEGLWRERGPASKPRWLTQEGSRALALADAAWITSGTATLEGLLVGCPMVVAYRASAVSAWIARHFLGLDVRWVSFPNLLARESLVPEFLQETVTPEALADALLTLLRNPERRAFLRSRFRTLGRELRCDFGLKVASGLDRMMATGGRGDPGR